MCDHLHLSDKLARVRDKLTAEKVQLWTPPYYVTGIGPSDSDLQVKIRNRNYSNNNMSFIFQALAERFSTPLGLSRDCCLCALTELQSAALENLDSRTLFQDSGMNQLFFVYFK